MGLVRAFAWWTVHRSGKSPTATGLLIALAVSACGGGSSGQGASPASPAAAMSDLAGLGELIFEDESLSASGRMACQTCHLPEHAHSGPPTEAVAPGGADLELSGLRNSPSIRYASLTPAFHFQADGTPVGGFFRDGRAASLTDQARRPFLDALEMANPFVAAVADKLRRAAHVSEFTRLFGVVVFDDPVRALDSAALALARYQSEDPDFRPFDSKYDAFLAGRATLTDQEINGLALFNNPLKGNCAACHPSARGADGSPPMFTDFTYDNLGVPRNGAIPVKGDPEYVDLGLCGLQRTDLAAQRELCGAIQGAFSAQRLPHRAVLSQRPLPHAGGGDRVLRAPRYQPRRSGTRPGRRASLDSTTCRSRCTATSTRPKLRTTGSSAASLR